MDNHSSSDVLLYAFSPHQLTQSVNVSTLTYFMSKHLVQGHFAGFCVRCSQQVCCLKPLTLKSQPAFITYINISIWCTSLCLLSKCLQEQIKRLFCFFYQHSRINVSFGKPALFCSRIFPSLVSLCRPSYSLFPFVFPSL